MLLFSEDRPPAPRRYREKSSKAFPQACAIRLVLGEHGGNLSRRVNTRMRLIQILSQPDCEESQQPLFFFERQTVRSFFDFLNCAHSRKIALSLMVPSAASLPFLQNLKKRDSASRSGGLASFQLWRLVHLPWAQPRLFAADPHAQFESNPRPDHAKSALTPAEYYEKIPHDYREGNTNNAIPR